METLPHFKEEEHGHSPCQSQEAERFSIKSSSVIVDANHVLSARTAKRRGDTSQRSMVMMMMMMMMVMVMVMVEMIIGADCSS